MEHAGKLLMNILPYEVSRLTILVIELQKTIAILHISLLFLNQGLGVPTGYFSRRMNLCS